MTMDEMSLYDAAKNNDVMGVKNILKSSCKVDINAENEAGITPLIEACINGNKEMVEILLDAGSPAQPAAGFRHTPLRGAVVCGHDHLISLLLSKGADPNALSEGNRTPLMGACFLRKGVPAEQSVKCVKELLNDQRTDASILNSFGESALDLAKIRGYTESIVLIEKVLNLEE